MTFGDELTINGVVYVFVDFRLIRRATGYSDSICTFCHVGRPRGPGCQKDPRNKRLYCLGEDQGVFVKKLEV